MEITGTFVISPVFIVLFEFAVKPLDLGPQPHTHGQDLHYTSGEFRELVSKRVNT